jgi:hypothetical protein
MADVRAPVSIFALIRVSAKSGRMIHSRQPMVNCDFRGVEIV